MEIGNIADYGVLIRSGQALVSRRRSELACAEPTKYWTSILKIPRLTVMVTLMGEVQAFLTNTYTKGAAQQTSPESSCCPVVTPLTRDLGDAARR